MLQLFWTVVAHACTIVARRESLKSRYSRYSSSWYRYRYRYDIISIASYHIGGRTTVREVKSSLVRSSNPSASFPHLHNYSLHSTLSLRHSDRTHTHTTRPESSYTTSLPPHLSQHDTQPHTLPYATVYPHHHHRLFTFFQHLQKVNACP
eukprot:COSAG05_NODE_3_length_51333_cov_129.132080_14_plen_150_part_00